MRNIYFLVILLLANFTVHAQSKKISGSVKADNGQPLPGVTVFIKGTSVGTATNAQGSFALDIPTSATTITFSLMGMNTLDEPINNRDVIDVILTNNDKQLQEVVVTALGISRDKKALGYAVQEVKSTELQTRPSNALSALSGKVAGLQVISSGGNMGGSNRVLLRGINSISGNNQPLYVIDGVPLDNSDLNTKSTASGSAGKDIGNMIQDLNPDDIETISALKGPSAAALYGTRAANGVILITTKRGKAGKRFDVSVNSGVDFENVVRLPARQKLYGGGYATTFQEATINGQKYKIVDYAADESWGPKLDGTPVLHWYNLDPENSAEYLKPDAWVYPKNDVTSFFNTGLSFTNNVSFSGGNENQNFRLSYTNKNVTGTVPNSSLQRNTLNFSGSSKFDKFTASVNFNYVKNQSTGRPWTGATNRNIMLEAYQWAQVQVDYKKLSNYMRADGTQILWNRSSYQNTTAGEAAKFIDNPYWSAYKSYLEENRDRFYGNVGLAYDVNNWLSLSTKINADVYNYQNQDRIAVYSRSQSYYSEYSNNFSEFNYEFLASAKKKWNDFSLNAFAGGNIMNQKRRISNATTQGGLIIPDYYSLKNAASVLVDPFFYHKSIYSLYGSFSLGYKNFWFLDGTIRNDWSSTLPVNNNSFAYPSLTSSVILSELAPFKSLSWLNFAKVRVGWAQVGNDTDPYQLALVYDPVQAFQGNSGYKLPNIQNNAALKPEITSSWETGITLKALNNRVGLDVTYYNSNSRNQIINIPTSTAYGFDSKYVNAGKINNQGIEVSLNVVPIVTKDFEWNVNVNWSRNRNKVVKLIDGVSSLTLADALVTLVAAEGQPYGQLMGYDFVYDANGKKVVKADGTYARTEQLRPLGSVLPDYIFGFQQQFRYKNWDASVLVDGRVGGKFFSQTYKVGVRAGILENTAANNIRETGVVLDGVQGDITFNPNGTYTVTNTKTNTVNTTANAWALGNYNGPTTEHIFSGTFVKLREITLGYNVPMSKTGVIRGIRVGAYGRNLWNIYQASKYIDPEITNSGGNIQGVEGGNIPVPVNYGVNVQVKF
ncbi:TonB-linked SusC/RagA family outer membrane protein [Chitinophaga skermanii]|uniref:TonB-linked SusC/RagA family outer membrane protein n=1 Tax=Chitinophaga skermanii TaxID=331697 RepID=A0A327Q4L8_9BACT|nr:SusC/RagA family TonB-linked outer membrane protein [Chitinophaga skermanii]RAI99455.1 TonB-linked SusC/RagA family outer membrane protein [Chitinophaga skermanii]